MLNDESQQCCKSKTNFLREAGKKFSQKLQLQSIDLANDKDDNDEEEVVVKKKKRRKAKPSSDDEEDADMQNDAESVASSDVLTISDNDSIQEDVEEEGERITRHR